PSSLMIFLEDIIELIEDVPDELQRRGGLIQDWERQASEYKKQADSLTARLHNDKSLKDEEKAILFRQISEMLDRAKDLTSKKYDMAEKCHQLIQKLSDRVSDWSYHCKLELEVDAPGSTFQVENSFINETVMAATAAANVRSQGFRVPDEKPQPPQRDNRGSSSLSREGTPLYGIGNRASHERRATRDSSMSSSRASSTTPFDQHAATAAAAVQQLQLQRKRKRDRAREKQLRDYQKTLQQTSVAAVSGRGGSAAAAAAPPPLSSKEPLSSYMRKKKEREREERKLREVSQSRLLAAAAAAGGGLAAASLPDAGYSPVHANREQRASQQRVIKPEPLDDGYEQPQAPPTQYHHQQLQPSGRRPGPGRPSNASRVQANNALLHAPPPPPAIVKREEMQPERREEQDEMINNGGMSDPDNDDDLLKFLEDEMPGGIADHDDLHLGLEGENLFDLDSFGANLGRELEKIQEQRPPSPLSQHIYGYLNAPSKTSADSGASSRAQKGANKAERKRQQAAQQQPQFVTFGAGESLHGRQRKLTARATDHVMDLDTRERRRRQKEEEVSHGDYGHGGGRSMMHDPMGAEGGGEDDVDNTPYCYCRQPSDGEMVGCDGKRCRFGGWFHLHCLGMLAPPTIDKWYCRDCDRYR
ncbi:hypothetical protein PMAYCL1PPCAC_05346, partial [Pristionchus mayeri]